jgi:TonB-dependent SusC/RagA subfamily outer membrane receptor
LLEALLQPANLRYEQVQSNILLKKITNSSEPGTTAPLFNGGIKGKVTNAKGEPLTNASIVLVGSSKGTAADSRGEFSISDIPAGKYAIQVSAIGFKSSVQQVVVNDNEMLALHIQLTADDNRMEEVVVTALGITRKERAIGYAAQQISGDNLTMAKDQNVLGALGGKIAGVQVSGSSAASMGGTQKIQIRGVNLVTGSGEPLIVVDNTPISNSNFAEKDGRDYGNLAQDINPDDIESINVLKGPAASALYGLRGQFGVIMITTKKGSRNKKPTVSFGSAFSFEKAGNFMPLQNTYGAGSNLNFPTIKINGVDTKYVDGSWDESWGPKMDGTLVRHQNSFYAADPEIGRAHV